MSFTAGLVNSEIFTNKSTLVKEFWEIMEHTLILLDHIHRDSRNLATKKPVLILVTPQFPIY